jgi:hypothetical protein
MTVKQAATLMNVSETSVRKARAVLAMRPDLAPAIEAGTLRLDRAYRIATGKKPSSRVDRAAALWRNMTADERSAFAVRISEEGRST